MQFGKVILGLVLPATALAQGSGGAMSALSEFSTNAISAPVDKHSMDASLMGLIVFSAAGLFLL